MHFFAQTNYIWTNALYLSEVGIFHIPVINLSLIQILQGPRDANSLLVMPFHNVYAVGLRLEPVTWTNNISVQVELYACLYKGEDYYHEFSHMLAIHTLTKSLPLSIRM